MQAVCHYDVVIVGGGGVGLSLLARLCQNSSLKIALLESKAQANINLKTDALENQDRFIVLSDLSRRFYEALGCWSDIEAASSILSTIQLSVKGQYGTSLLKACEIDVPALGYVIPLYRLEYILESLCHSDAIERGASLVTCTYDSKWHLSYSKNSQIHEMSADCLIGADGQGSLVRVQNNIGLNTKSYGHQAIIGTVAISSPLKEAAFERFLSQGAIAILPLKGNRAVFIWTLPDNQAKDYFQKSESDFLSLLQSEFGYRLGYLSDLKNKKVFPLTMTQSQCQGYAHKKLLLMGAAALNLHPIGAQGLNLSLKTIEMLGHLFDQSEGVLDFESLIKAYLSKIEAEQSQIQWLTDNLASYVSGGPFPLFLRGAGLMLFENIPLLKKSFTKLTSGIGIF